MKFRLLLDELTSLESESDEDKKSMNPPLFM
jgi:hypothetical protein